MSAHGPAAVSGAGGWAATLRPRHRQASALLKTVGVTDRAHASRADMPGVVEKGTRSGAKTHC